MKGSGFWFYTTYQQCPRKFWFNKVLRFRLMKRAPALSFGSAIHEAVAQFHRSHDIDEAKIVFTKNITESETAYANEEKFVLDANRGLTLLSEYGKKYAGDKDRYEVLCQETELSCQIGVYSFVFKPDRVSFDKQRRMRAIFEVKTTSYSVLKAHENVVYGDQVTAYLYAWNATHPNEPCECAIPDILYNKGNVSDCKRIADIYRTRIDLEEYALGLYSIIGEVSQKTAALDKFPPIQLFPRRGDCDGDGFYTCEYRGICRTGIDPTDPPHGYCIEPERSET